MDLNILKQRRNQAILNHSEVVLRVRGGPAIKRRRRTVSVFSHTFSSIKVFNYLDIESQVFRWW